MFYLINKKKWISSFKSISEFAKKNNIKKIGHTGTLDPLASGLLLVATDDDTKLIEYIDKGSKSYIAQMKLGYISDTLDSEGKVEATNIPWEEDKVNEVIMSYVKTYDQMPPDFSAKKINGKRAYELAREGKVVKLKTSRVTIDEIKNIKKVDNDTYEFEVKVSRGTYIRSLIKDIGTDLKSGAIMTNLIRNKVAGLSLEDVGKEINAINLIKIQTIIIEDLDSLFHGKSMEVIKEDGQYAVENNKDIIGIVNVENNQIIKRKLFGNKYKG